MEALLHGLNGATARILVAIVEGADGVSSIEGRLNDRYVFLVLSCADLGLECLMCVVVSCHGFACAALLPRDARLDEIWRVE